VDILVRLDMNSTRQPPTQAAGRDTTQESAPYRAARAYAQVLGLLSKSRWISASEVQSRLAEVGWDYGKRAVEKMLKSLADEHSGVERDDSVKPYLYRWSPDRDNPWNPELSDRESLTLALAAEHLRQLLPAEVQQWMDGRFREARRRMDPVRGAEPLNSWPQKVAVVSQLPPMIPPAISPEVYAHVSQALLADCWLNIDYRNAAGKVSRKSRVMPLALVQQSERLFLVCKYDGYQDIRNLALHRILMAEATPHRFERPGSFSLEAYISKGGFGFGNGALVRLELIVQEYLAELLSETPLTDDQEIERMEGGVCRVTATVLHSEQIRWWIRMHGNSILQVQPASLMNEVDSARPAKTEGVFVL
jgi:predicted DNA-binding transcriptional regulator YafY